MIIRDVPVGVWSRNDDWCVRLQKWIIHRRLLTLIPIISCNRFGQYYTVYQQSTNIIHSRRRWMTDTIVITRFALLFIYYKIQIRSTIYSNIIFHYSIFSMNTRIVIWSKKTTYEKYFSVLSEARISIEYISMSNGLIFVWWWACEQYDCLSWLALLIVCVLSFGNIYTSMLCR